MSKCNKCGHICHCGMGNEHKITTSCNCNGCDCGVEVEGTNGGGGIVIDDTNECETCQ